MTDRRTEEIRKARELISEILSKIENFSFDQIAQIEYGFTLGLPVEFIRFYARIEFNDEQMYDIVQKCAWEGIFLEHLEQLQKYITPQLNNSQIEEILLWLDYDLDFERFAQEFGGVLSRVSAALIRCAGELLEYGMPWERVKEFIQICKEKNFVDRDDNSKKIYIIYEGILAGLTKEEIELYIKPEYDTTQMSQIIDKLIKQKENELLCKNKEISSFISSLERSGEFTKEQLKEIKFGFLNGLTIDQVRLYTDPRIYEYKMRLFRLYLQIGYPKEYIELLVHCYREKCLFVKELGILLRDGLPFDFIKFLVDFYISEGRSSLKKMMRRLKKLPKDQIVSYCEKIQSLMETYRKAGFTLRQIEEIVFGYLDGLSEEQIKTYAKHEFYADQMEQIRLAYLDGLTQEEVEFLADPQFKESQMRIIRAAFKYGLSFEQVKKLAMLKCDYSHIKEIFLGYLWGLPEELINFYMNFKLNVDIESEDIIIDTKALYTRLSQQTIRASLLKGITLPEVEFTMRRLFSQKHLYSTTEEFYYLLQSDLEKLANDKETRAKVRTLVNLNTRLIESWKSQFEMKNKRKDKNITL